MSRCFDLSMFRRFDVFLFHIVLFSFILFLLVLYDLLDLSLELAPGSFGRWGSLVYMRRDGRLVYFWGSGQGRALYMMENIYLKSIRIAI